MNAQLSINDKYLQALSQTTEIDNGINLLLTQIEKLKDYKTTQINSAIKGKIKITPEMVEQ